MEARRTPKMIVWLTVAIIGAMALSIVIIGCSRSTPPKTEPPTGRQNIAKAVAAQAIVDCLTNGGWTAKPVKNDGGGYSFTSKVSLSAGDQTKFDADTQSCVDALITGAAGK